MCGDADKYSGWAEEQWCKCGAEHYCSERILFLTVEMVANKERALMQAMQIAAPLLHTHTKAPMHCVVEVEFKCGQCEHRFHETFERVGRIGKRSRVGHYLVQNKIKRTSALKVPYALVYEQFDKMWSGGQFSLLHHSCKHWGRDLFQAVTKQPNRGKEL